MKLNPSLNGPTQNNVMLHIDRRYEIQTGQINDDKDLEHFPRYTILYKETSRGEDLTLQSE